MAKRRRRKSTKPVSWWMLAAIGLLIAGFIARRLTMPPAARYLTHRADNDAPANPPADTSASNGAPPAHTSDNSQGEHLSDRDRRALDEMIRRKTESH